MSSAVPRDAAFEAYNGLTVTLPTGRTIRGRPLPFALALEFLEQMEAFEFRGAAARDSVGKVLARFPEAVGIDAAELDGLTLAEAMDLVKRFFYHRRADLTGLNPASPAAPPASAAAAPPPPSAPSSSS